MGKIVRASFKLNNVTYDYDVNTDVINYHRIHQCPKWFIDSIGHIHFRKTSGKNVNMPSSIMTNRSCLDIICHKIQATDNILNKSYVKALSASVTAIKCSCVS